MKRIALIGTAGRSNKHLMTRALWDWMLADVSSKLPQDVHLISGGAAWADHLAVILFLDGRASKLTLHLPAPLNGRYLGPFKSSASAANYYHDLFSKAVGMDSLAQIHEAAAKENCEGTFEQEAEGYAAMRHRNFKVANDSLDGMLAYTWGEGHQPADGGTKMTWDITTHAEKLHVSLHNFFR